MCGSRSSMSRAFWTIAAGTPAAWRLSITSSGVFSLVQGPMSRSSSSPFSFRAPSLDTAVDGVVHDGRPQGAGGRLDLREDDPLPLAGLSTVAQGGEDGGQGVDGIDDVVRVVRPEAHGRPVDRE